MVSTSLRFVSRPYWGPEKTTQNTTHCHPVAQSYITECRGRRLRHVDPVPDPNRSNSFKCSLSLLDGDTPHNGRSCLPCFSSGPLTLTLPRTSVPTLKTSLRRVRGRLRGGMVDILVSVHPSNRPRVRHVDVLPRAKAPSALQYPTRT